MSATQYFPIPLELLTLTCETINRRVGQLPFMLDGCSVTQDRISVSIECLNAEFSKTLSITTKQTADNRVSEGLDRCLEQRLNLKASEPCAAVIAGVLCSAGIAEKTEVLDRVSHARYRGVRLLPPWTWHSASAPVSSLSAVGVGTEINTSSEPWMSLCPVCRTGILNRVVGKQLYGIPHTDYYIECTHCGAKFISEKDKFCLVSIATIRDPAWKHNLTKSFSPESWMEIARASGTGTPKRASMPSSHRSCLASPSSAPHSSPPRNPIVSVMLKTGTLLSMKDGSLGVPVLDKILYFKPVKLIFSGGLKEDVFEKEQKALKDVINSPSYSHLKAKTEEKYSNYIPLRLGLFLWERKEKHDPFYREFLNPWGDEKYGTFMVEDSDLSRRKGVYLVVIDGKATHAGHCHESFKKTLTQEFSRITAGDCYLDRDGTRCRINALLCSQRKTSSIYLHAIDNEEERIRIVDALMNNPPALPDKTNP
ncbi:MAG: hypothetical protein WC626_09195 [Methanoregula sp.]